MSASTPAATLAPILCGEPARRRGGTTKMPDKQHGPTRRNFLAGAVLGAGGAALVDNTLFSGSALAADSGSSISAASAAVIGPGDQQYPDLVVALNPRWTARPDNVFV